MENKNVVKIEHLDQNDKEVIIEAFAESIVSGNFIAQAI